MQAHIEGTEITDEQDAFERRLENDVRTAVATIGLMTPIAFEHPKCLLEAVLIKLRSEGHNFVADDDRPLPDTLGFDFVVVNRDTGAEHVIHFDLNTACLESETATVLEADLVKNLC